MTRIVATGLRFVDSSDHGKAIMVGMTSKGGDVELILPTDSVPVLLPFLAKAEQMARAKAGDPDGTMAFPAEGQLVGIADSEVVLSLMLPHEVRFTFRLSPQTAAATGALLVQLAAQVGLSG